MLLPLLLATLAPVASLSSAAAALGVVAIAAQSTTTWASALPVLAVAVTAAVFTWRRRAPLLATSPVPDGWLARLRRAAPPWAAGGGAALVVGAGLWALRDEPFELGGIRGPVLAGVLAAASAELPVLHIVWGSGFRSATDPLAPVRRILGGLLVGFSAGVAAGGVVAVLGSSAWTAFLALYAGLLVTLAALYVWLSLDNTRSSERTA